MPIVWNLRKTVLQAGFLWNISVGRTGTRMALYYGAVYYGQPCRYAPYSTGDWQMDYFVTQMAIHVLNGEYTLEAMLRGMNKSQATQGEGACYSRISRLVSDAKSGKLRWIYCRWLAGYE